MYTEKILEIPEIALFLDSVDQVLNANTFLLPFSARKFLEDGAQPVDVFRAILSSREFSDAMYHNDRIRDWDNYHVLEPDENGKLEWERIKGDWVKADAGLDLRSVSEIEFTGRLDWFLTKAFSPYDQHLEPENAQAVVSGFLEALAKAGSGWHYFFVEPTFLHPTGYWKGCDDFQPYPLAYFDGSEMDTVTFFFNAEVIFVLLTNGRA